MSAKSYEFEELEDRLAAARAISDVNRRLERIKQTLLTNATQLLVDHLDMMNQLAVELERSFGRDFGLRQVVALGKASVEDMKATV
jgi:hypothetical protein